MLDIGHGTHVGYVRQNNEDSYRMLTDDGLWVVADGMGGHACGEVASRLAVDTLCAAVPHGTGLSDAIYQAHQAIRTAWRHGEGARDMGTTLVALRLEERRFEVAWVGDSRAYLWNGELTRLSHDHTLVQEMVDKGMLSDAEAATFPAANVLTQSLGSPLTDLRVETCKGTLTPGSAILLCSDGLTHLVGDRIIAELLAGQGNAQNKVDRLIEAALDRGGIDNITVVLVALTGNRSGSFFQTNQ